MGALYFAGHGIDAERVKVEVLNFFLDAGAKRFLEIFDSMDANFTELFEKSIRDQMEALLKGNSSDGYHDFARDWLELQARMAMIDKVFVYGTLMSGNVANQRFLASQNCTMIGEGMLQGYHLYDLDSYPAIRPGKSKPFTNQLLSCEIPAIVLGELYQVKPDDLEAIDKYEGEGSLYDRVAVMIQSIGENHLAWTYVYRNPLDSDRIIPAGEQPWHADRNQKGQSRYVWYAGYGSNLLKERFIIYITGGRFRESIKDYSGCHHKTHPMLDQMCTINRKLYFGNEKSSWGDGSVCFLDVNQAGKTFGRIYLIRQDQLEDINAQEGKSSKWYDFQFNLGEIDGIPVVTLTNHAIRPTAKPNEDYLKIVKEGLIETGSRQQISLDIDQYLEQAMNSTP